MSFKNIAVPPRTTTKKRGQDAPNPPPGLAYAPATGEPVTTRTTRPGQTHRFAVGQRLSMAPGGRDISRGASACSVVSLLPHEGGPLRYRVRSDNENYERIIDETDLSPLPPGAE